MAYRLNSELCSNWVKASQGLTTTKEAFHDPIESEFNTFAILNDASDHLCCIIAKYKKSDKNIKKGKLNGKTKWSISCGCDGCQTFIDAVAEKHANPNRINWENIANDNDKDVDIPEYWTIAKLFMPKTPRSRVSSGPQAADAVAIFEILKTCKLFDGFDISDVIEMIEVRNNLMHSAALELSDSDTVDAFDAMKKLLESNAMQYSIYSINAIDDLEKLRDPSTWIVSSSSERCDMQRKALSLRKESLKYDKDMYKSMGRAFAHFDDMIKKTNDQLNLLAGTSTEGRRRDKNENVRAAYDLAAGTTGGAATGATIGAIGGPPGIMIGAAVGGLVGLITGIKRTEEEF